MIQSPITSQRSIALATTTSMGLAYAVVLFCCWSV